MNKLPSLHSSFYYVSKEHLLVNMYQYIADGIKNDKLIYVSMEPNLYTELINKITSSEIPKKDIEFHSVKELITGYKSKQKSIKETIIKQENLNSNYTGVRWIGQPSYAIQETSKEDFLEWEKQLTKAFKETNSSMLCIYDFNNYLKDKVIIDKKIINESLKTHSYTLNQFALKKIEKLFSHQRNLTLS